MSWWCTIRSRCHYGCLVSSIGETAARIVQILREPALGRRLGRRARRTVQENFLLTRLLEHYLDLLRKP